MRAGAGEDRRESKERAEIIVLGEKRKWGMRGLSRLIFGQKRSGS
jgi:hypothetical protein